MNTQVATAPPREQEAVSLRPIPPTTHWDTWPRRFKGRVDRRITVFGLAIALLTLTPAATAATVPGEKPWPLPPQAPPANWYAPVYPYPMWGPYPNWFAPPRAPVPIDPCMTTSADILVNTRFHRLHLCGDRRTERWFWVSLGAGGIGKTKRGDKKTPLGLRDVGYARKSVSGYHLFIPLDYPTAEERASAPPGTELGGGAKGPIGIHGPHPKRSPGKPGQPPRKDWTDGCIAVGSVEEIETIADWLKRLRSAGAEPTIDVR